MQQILQGKVGQVVRLSSLTVFSAAVFVFGLAFATPASAVVTTSIPVSVGNYSEWNLGVGSTKTNAVTSSDGDASYIIESSNGDDQTYNMSGAGIPAGSTVNSVSLFVVARRFSNAFEPHIKLRLEQGTGSGNQSDGSDLTLTTPYATYIRPLPVNPFTGLAWTASEVNSWAVKFGVRKTNSSGAAVVTQVYVLVDYNLPPDTTAPVVTQVTPITTPTNNTSPTYVFHSTEAGTIFYGGACSNETAPGGVGNHTITFGTLAPGVYSNCTIQIADASANTSTVLAIPSFTIDTAAPVISAHPSVTAEATGPTGAVVTYTLPTATDNVDVSVVVTCTPASGSLFVLGSTNVTCNATDAAGNSATPTGFSVRVVDTTDPLIFAHTNVVVEATSLAGATVSYTSPNATDAVSGIFVATCEPVSGTLFVIGTSTVTCSATDTADNTAESTFSVIVQDITPPTITLIGTNPVDLYTGDVYVDAGATATDIVDGDLTSSIVIDSSSINNLVPFSYLVTYTSTDSRGNISTVTRTVFVSDHSAPVIDRIPDMTVEATSALNTIVDYGIMSATDDVVGTFGLSTASCVPLSGSAFPIGTTPVICTAADSAPIPNVGVGLALNVIVQDTTAPVVIVNAPLAPVEATSTLGAEAFYTVDATDTVDAGVGFSIECSIASGSIFPIGFTVVTCSAQDEMGNRATSTATVIVRDSTAPELTPPATQTFEATGLLTTPVLVPATATDLVDPAPMVTSSRSSFPLGTTAVLWQAMDASGNINFGVLSNVIIIDTTAPVITLHGEATITLTVGGSYTEQGASVTDNHDTEMPAPTVGGDVVNTAVAGTYVVTYNAHDGSGNNAVQQVRTVIVNAIPSSGGGSGGGGGSFVMPTPPSFGDVPVTVGGGLGSTSTVQLVFDVRNASWMAISETPDFSTVSWVPYTTSTTFTLSASNTGRKLYIKFRRVNGGETKVQEVTVLANSPSTLIQAVLGVRITRLNELATKLKFGNRGAEVRELQNLLKEAKYFPASQTATGYYGPITRASVKKYLAAIKQ